VTGKKDGNFTIRYDTKRMYAGKGVDITVQGDGKAGVQASDDGSGSVNVTVGDGAEGKKFTVFVHPKGSTVKA